jgi:hypothetical protein
MKCVEGPEVVNDGEELGEHGCVLWMLGNQDILENILQLTLHFSNQLRVPQTRTI